ncbi:MAG TPA: 23S rRNA (adenine(2503)-C(2))-methyltransferase RlmN [Candidatus Portnoybacteria bacterium]|jgi:23S rRNA (adenine2503-C2)-methyltransferase|nr:23S rRNA (adenine(2503)-C(2))-methyltransferase RlmN [Candidatus Portnoybacteria bacterium]MDD5752242.1 23S rRNA (adenine(2503)-C(2))-methyltransferase RlmN [Candidatus Portnoybacteria bacterium]HNU96820.1 23S rRNA (adenine(2503)-C(2))-methyltransferase RlmN [Candidatus Portnoybacteria bacterium]HOZ16506.1 23S rRNA (adenine(2503)-C(2))-methyltransferase RlmN [Candidatus Portnoybacteria bacterium]HPH52266.1 23S rRNA (adenine(2503)-C(2))-methyltransferase RlmN [Candidatus Portnoybacteria bacte
MNYKLLEEILIKEKQPKYRLEQIKKAIYQNGISSFLEIKNISKELREILNTKIQILSFVPEKILISMDKKSVKALLKLKDGNFIETILISPKPGLWSVCVSSQVGCALNCRFCATGKMGFKRNLSAEEITDQILFWIQYLKIENSKLKIQNNISNIVFMGMGEPFLNYENVKQSLIDLTDKNLFCFGARSISVSTSGIMDKIKNFAKEFPQINLAISLHFADNEKRNKYMSINKQYDLRKIKQGIEKYFETTKRKIFIEYILLKDINDTKEDINKLLEYLKSIKNHYLLHVNLIRYNAIKSEFKASDYNKIQKIKNFLINKKISTTIRKSLGSEISGACGQLTYKN